MFNIFKKPKKSIPTPTTAKAKTPTGYKTTLRVHLTTGDHIYLVRTIWDIGQGDFIWDPAYYERTSFQDITDWFNDPNSKTKTVTLTKSVFCLNKAYITHLAIESEVTFKPVPDDLIMPEPIED